MAETIKVLAQSAPAATTLTDVYTVPASTVSVVSSIVVCNRGSAKREVRLSVAVAGASDSVEQYLAWDTPVVVGDPLVFTLGLTMGAADVLRAYVDAADISVSVFGTEVS